MTITPDGTLTVRHLDMSDLGILLRAQEATRYELDAMTAEEITFQLLGGNIQGLVLERDHRTMIVCWQQSGRDALLTTLYHEGRPQDFLADFRLLRERLRDVLAEWGIEHVFVCVSLRNPDFERLLRLYRRCGLREDMLRMGMVL